MHSFFAAQWGLRTALNLQSPMPQITKSETTVVWAWKLYKLTKSVDISYIVLPLCQDSETTHNSKHLYNIPPSLTVGWQLWICHYMIVHWASGVEKLAASSDEETTSFGKCKAFVDIRHSLAGFCCMLPVKWKLKSKLQNTHLKIPHLRFSQRTNQP